MITSAKQVDRFTPVALCDENGKPQPGAVVYLIQAPTLQARAEWRRELSDRGARHVSRDSLMATLRRGIKEVVAEDQRDELLAFCDEYDAAEREVAEASAVARDLLAAMRPLEDYDEDEDNAAYHAESEEIAAPAIDAINRQAELIGRMEDLEGQMRRMYPPYSRKIGEQVYWLETAPLTAAQMFLIGAENSKIKITRERGLVPMDVVSSLPDGHAVEIGWRVVGLMNLIGHDLKNSDGPSSSASKPKRSARTKLARGTSSAKK